MSYLRGDAICPQCQRVMVKLAEFDARADSVGVSTGGWGPSRYGRGQVRSGVALFGFFETIMEWLGGHAKQKRLDGVYRQYPNSLYCPGCGYIERRV